MKTGRQTMLQNFQNSLFLSCLLIVLFRILEEISLMKAVIEKRLVQHERRSQCGSKRKHVFVGLDDQFLRERENLVEKLLANCDLRGPEETTQVSEEKSSRQVLQMEYCFFIDTDTTER